MRRRNRPINPSFHDPRSGVIAVEVVIAAVIFTVAAVGAYRAVDQVKGAAGTTFTRTRSLSGARDSLKQLAQDLRRAGHIQIDQSKSDHVLTFRLPVTAAHRDVNWGCGMVPGGWIQYRVAETPAGRALTRSRLDSVRKRVDPEAVLVRGLVPASAGAFTVDNARNLYTVTIRLRGRADGQDDRPVVLKTTSLARNWRAAQILQAPLSPEGTEDPDGSGADATPVGGDTNSLITTLGGSLDAIDAAELATSVDKAQADLGRIAKNSFLRRLAIGLTSYAVDRVENKIAAGDISPTNGENVQGEMLRFATWLAADTAAGSGREAMVASEVSRANGLAANGDMIGAMGAARDAFNLASGRTR